MVDKRVALGQLNNTELTLRDLKVIIDSFTTTLKGTHHARVDYPDDDKTTASEIQTSSDDATLVEMRE